jgi:hypothetical protein
MTKNKPRLVQLTIAGNPRCTETVDILDDIRLVTLEVIWKASHVPEHLMLLLVWDKLAMGSPSLFDISASALNQQAESSSESGGVSMLTRKLVLEDVGRLGNLAGMYSQTLGPERQFTQIEIYGKDHPEIVFYGQFSYHSAFNAIQSCFVDTLRSLDVTPVAEWT